MRYEHLLNSGRIRAQEVSKNEIARALKRADRDLRTSKIIMAEDWDWGFAVAYNAVLQAARAYMFSKGFRTIGAEAHKNTFLFLQEDMGAEYQDMIAYFNRMRSKRNQVIYDVAGLISETEARNLLKQAEKFVKLMKKELG